MKTTKVDIRISHRCSIPGTYWCEPIGWEPTNKVNGFPSERGSWWDDSEVIAGLVWFGSLEKGEDEGDILEVDPSELSVASCGNCRVIAKVTIAE